MADGGSRWKLNVHGPVVDLQSTVPELETSLDVLLDEFSVPDWPENFHPVAGAIHPYEQDEVLGRISASARHACRTPDAIDIYEDGERFWLVDERWGMAEIDTGHHQWRSWVLPQPRLDPLRVAEMSVLWPMAQLLRRGGVHLLPAVSVVRDGFAVLMICPFSLEPELLAMINNSYRVIGQRWTALREEDGRLALLHLPGRLERCTTPRLRFSADEQETWADVTDGHPGSRQYHAFCDAVMVVEHGRHPKAHLRKNDPVNALNVLRRQWPIIELPSARLSNPLPAQLSQNCRCFDLQLSRNSKDLLALLNSVRFGHGLSDGQSSVAA